MTGNCVTSHGRMTGGCESIRGLTEAVSLHLPARTAEKSRKDLSQNSRVSRPRLEESILRNTCFGFTANLRL
jgi:hypothetical protein